MAFKNIGHFFASMAKDLVTVTKKAAPVLATIDHTVAANAPAVEAITALIDPNAVVIERLGFALFGQAAQLVENADQAALDKGLNITLDADTINDVKAVIPAVKQFAANSGITKPTN